MQQLGRWAIWSFLLIFCSPHAPLKAQPTIRSVDLTNFTYPWVEPDSWPGQQEWLSEKNARLITLKAGRWINHDDDDEFSKDLPLRGLTFEGATYGDLTGDGQPEAVAVLRYNTGGTQYHYFIYILSMQNGRAKLLRFLRSGDRSSHGFYDAKIANGHLLIWLYDPDHATGDCCSTGTLRYEFKWQAGNFSQIRAPKPEPARTPSRIPVTVFGTPSTAR